MGKLLDRFRQKGPSRPRSRAESEKRRRFLIVLLIVLAILAAGGTIGYGYYDTNVRPWHQRIVKVNGTVIEMRSFVKMLRLQQNYANYYSSSTEWARQAATGLEENELMRQGLEDQFGVDTGEITSDEAIEAFLRSMFVSNGKISDNATEDEYQQVYQDWLAGWKKTYGMSEKDILDLGIKPSLVQKELQKQIGDRDYPATDNFDHAQVQALLITGADNATLMRTRWENGEAFDTLTSDNSVSSYQRDTAADNTTIQWVPRGIKSEAFDNYTFSENTSLDVISQPILDSDGSENYWLIKVIGYQQRPLSESDRDTLVSAAFTKWLEDAKKPENNDIVYYPDEKGGTAKLNWAVAHVTVSTS